MSLPKLVGVFWEFFRGELIEEGQDRHQNRIAPGRVQLGVPGPLALTMVDVILEFRSDSDRAKAKLPQTALLFAGPEGAAPLPFAAVVDEARFHGVFLDVIPGVEEMLFVADVGVPVFTVPEGSGWGGVWGFVQIKNPVNLSGRVAFPGLDDFSEEKSFGLNEDMNVVGHDGPCEKAVAFNVALEE